jgi:DNA-binding NtrC family response regulator
MPHIIVIDDEISIQQIIILFLQQHGFTVSCFGTIGDFQDWLDHYTSQILDPITPSSFVIDMNLPDGNALDLLALLPKELQGIPIVISSGYDCSNEVLQIAKTRQCRQLMKPYPMASLIDILKSYARP